MTTPNLLKYIKHTHLYEALDEVAKRDIASELMLMALEEDDVLLHEGDHGNCLCVLVKGRLGKCVIDKDGNRQHLDDLSPGAVFGEEGLFTGEAQPHTVYALEPSEVVLFPEPKFDRLVEKNPEVMTRFSELMVPVLQHIQLHEVFEALFGNLSELAFSRLASELEWLQFYHGDRVVKQGEADHSLYIIISGRLQVVTENPDGTEQIQAEAGRGETIGEMALLTGGQRSATVYAIRDTVVARLSKQSFDTMIEQYPELLNQITHLIVERFQRSMLGQGQAPKSKTLTLALVPISPNVPMTKFAKHLVTALGSFAPTLYLTEQRFDGYLNHQGAAQTSRDHPTNLAIGAWLSEQESIYTHIVYQTDSTWNNWTQRCIQNADRILCVGWATGDCEPHAIEQEVARMTSAAAVELILLHPEQTKQPQNTRRWLAPRQVEGHYHVRINNMEDLQRLARRLSGRAVGLVLGGGAARGFAHIGAIKAIQEAGLPIDLVGGTSIGAIVAAVYNLGWDHETMVEAINTFMSSTKIFDPTLPVVSFARSKKMSKTLSTEFADMYIEDMWLPFFAVSSNISRAKPVVHQQGLLWKALRSTASLPGIFTPVVENGELLVDGAMTNNLPIDVMHSLCHGGPVIAVDVSSEMDLADDYPFEDNLSGWWVLWQKLNPFTPAVKFPPLFTTLLRCFDLSSVMQKQANKALADIFVDPPVAEFGPGDFKAYQELIDVGYETAQEAIELWVDEQVKLWAEEHE